MTWYVLVEGLGSPTDRPVQGDGGDFLDALTPMHASVGGGIVRDSVSGQVASWTARVSIEAPDPIAAATVATEAICNAATNAGLPAWPLSRVEAVEESMMITMQEYEANELTW